MLTCILSDMLSLSDSSSARFLVPSTFLRVVWASSRVDTCALDTLATDEMGQFMRKYTTPSTDTVTESLVRICEVKSCNYDAATTSDHPERWQFSLTTETSRDTGQPNDIPTFDVNRANAKKKTYLLWRDVKGHSSQINFHKVISAGQNKEKSWTEIKTLLLFFVSIIVNKCFGYLFRPSYTVEVLVEYNRMK